MGMTGGCETLEADHRHALQLMKYVEQLLELLPEGRAGEGFGEQDKKTLEALAQFLTQDLPVHIRQEEEVLFPALAEYLGEGGPLAVMEEEHRDIQKLSSEYAAWVGGHGVLQSARQGSAWKRLIDLLRSHIEKEEVILFPLVSEKLSLAERTQLLHALAAIKS